MEALGYGSQGDELQRANRIIGQFITSCSHSMRGPLKSIAGLTHLLQGYKQHSEKDMELFLDLIGNTLLKMEQMLDGLEHFMENAKREPEYKTANFAEIVDRVLKRYDEEIRGAGLRVAVNIHQPVSTPLDAARLQLIISYLLVNAIQYRDHAKKVSWINISIESASEGYSIRIGDNGIGIAEEHHEKIFHLFYRACEISTGSGVGLYIVHEVVKKLRGVIRVSSEPGHGTVFEIVLPKAV
jgi:signal transduction histidine kinase